MRQTAKQRGFTLPELLVAGGILIALLVLGAVLIRPSFDQADLRNAQRKVDLAMLAQAINRYEADNGKLPSSISTEEKFIGAGASESNLCADLVPEYLESMPVDLIGGAVDPGSSCLSADYVTGYSVKLEDDGKIVLAALYTEAENEVKVSLPSK